MINLSAAGLFSGYFPKMARHGLCCSFLLFGFSAAYAQAFAWAGIKQGRIEAIDVTAGTNYGLRVFLESTPRMCEGSSGNFAFLNDTDSNYKAYVAALLLAKAQGSTVILHTTLDSSGYCKLGYLSVRN